MTRPHEDASIVEESLVRAFVVPHRRERLLRLVASPKGRRKLLRQLAHFHGLDPRFAHRIPLSIGRSRRFTGSSGRREPPICAT